MTNAYARASEAATVICERLCADLRVAVVLGSGWAGVAEGLGTTIGEVGLAELPGVPPPTVAGHGGVARRRGARRSHAGAGWSFAPL